MTPVYAGNLNVLVGVIGNTLSMMQCIGQHALKANAWYTTKENWKEDDSLNLHGTLERLDGKLNTTISRLWKYSEEGT
jgi:hypothetical protein